MFFNFQQIEKALLFCFMENLFARQKPDTKNLRRFLIGAVVFGLTAVVIVPYKFRSEAGKVELRQTKSHEDNLENYDIRADKTQSETLMSFRAGSGKNAVSIADTQDKFTAAENALRQKVPNLKIEFNNELRMPETIAPDVKRGRAFLSAPSEVERSKILRGFIKQNNDLLGVSDWQADELKLAADYTNPDGNLSFSSFKQEINGVPVFRGEVKAGFSKKGEIIRLVNNLAPDLDYKAVSNDFGNPQDAVNHAASYLNNQIKTTGFLRNDAASNNLKTVFGESEHPTTAEKIYFPTEAGVARAAWRVLIWGKVNAYYVIVDAETGKMLWRKNITEDQTQPATFSVYANPTSMINVAYSPFPLSPGSPNPTLGVQGAAINRTNITLVGNEAPFTFNNKGWISDGENRTKGNAVEAGIDRDNTDGIDPQGMATGSNNRSFVYPYSPGDPNANAAGDAPNPSPQTYPINAFQNGVVTQLFYISNRFHDEMYRLGFTEAAGNFQTDNFGRGGAGNDSVSAEAQDSSGVNNANFSAPADGNRGKMQMYLWDAPDPDFDGDLDAGIVIHELTHGLSNRLHGNSSGLNTNMARGMGEGWSDFYALSMLSSPTDPIDGIYTIGGYSTYLGKPDYRSNNYHGIRRFPKTVMAATGENGKPHNPLTFKHLNANCNTEIGTPTAIGTISAYARGAYGSTTCDQVHVAGEIWSSALWEVRAKFVARLGWEIGNRKALQLVTDAMKLATLNPTFLQERDAIIAAAQASGTPGEAEADVADVWEGFRIRGMGFSARVDSISPANVVEAFDLPNVVQSPDFTITDAGGNNNGFAEPNETVVLSIPLTNSAGKTAFGTTIQIAGGNAVSYGDIANNQTVTKNITFTVPANQSCGTVLTLTLNINSSLGAKTETRILIIGQPIIGNTENFDNQIVPNLPAGWTSTQIGDGVNWTAKPGISDTNPNSAFTPNTGKAGGANLESPAYNIASAAAVLKFRNNYNTEKSWDGGVLEIGIGGAAFQDILDAGGTFLENGYNGAIGANQNPLDGRAAWTGNSNGYITTRVLLPASAKGKTVKFKWRFGEDTNTLVVGWNIDAVEIVSNYSCGGNANLKSRADFDGDGKTDVSVYRPSQGNWFLNNSDTGFKAVNWGVSTDVPLAGDFDGDRKADVAVWRPANGFWYIVKSSDGGFTGTQWGMNGDMPVSGDFDGDGKTDIAVYRPSNGFWYLNRSRDGFVAVQFGQNDDVCVPADYDGDGKTDVAVYRSGNWIINKSSGGIQFTPFGLGTDKPVAADFDGDDKDEIAVYRPSNGFWYISKNGGYESTQFGIVTDIPVAGDYDGDGKDDIAVYRAGTWHINASKTGVYSANFGLPNDVPIPKQYVP
jgi:hypothetical protein